jgi:hypothetical protein
MVSFPSGVDRLLLANHAAAESAATLPASALSHTNTRSTGTGVCSFASGATFTCSVYRAPFGTRHADNAQHAATVVARSNSFFILM